ncbi:MAG TPA: hypothetical protein VFO29_02710 [Candidatus Rubrimentiphilum sp.]|nr:hypothetical protein [Candidatus Rubrimentiphilum sp.]
MRTVSALTLALLAFAPLTAGAAGDPYSAIEQMRTAFSGVQSVQLVERFSNGAVATIQLAPSAAPRVAAAGVSNNQLLLDYATQPGGDRSTDVRQLFTVTPLGHKSLYGMNVEGYRLVDRSGVIETVWINAHDLPVSMHVEANGQSMDVLYGDYGNPTYFAAKPKR